MPEGASSEAPLAYASIRSQSELTTANSDCCVGSSSKDLIPEPAAEVMKPLTLLLLKSHRIDEMLAYREMACLARGTSTFSCCHSSCSRALSSELRPSSVIACALSVSVSCHGEAGSEGGVRGGGGDGR